MYPSSDLDSLLTSDCSSSVSPAPCYSPFPSSSFKENQSRLVLNKNATSYAILSASGDVVFSADSISDLWTVNGSVNLVLGDAQDIHSVVISVRGDEIADSLLDGWFLGPRPNCHQSQRYQTHYLSRYHTNALVKKQGFKLSLQQLSDQQEPPPEAQRRSSLAI